MVIEKENISMLKGCPVDFALSYIDKKWTINIIKNMLLGSKRFNEILNDCKGLSTKVLSQRLKDLEEKKLIIKKIKTTTPLIIEYELTKKGKALRKVLYELAIYTLENHTNEIVINPMKNLNQTKADVKKMFLLTK